MTLNFNSMSFNVISMSFNVMLFIVPKFIKINEKRMHKKS
jgi:hypothetical protein